MIITKQQCLLAAEKNLTNNKLTWWWITVTPVSQKTRITLQCKMLTVANKRLRKNKSRNRRPSLQGNKENAEAFHTSQNSNHGKHHNHNLLQRCHAKGYTKRAVIEIIGRSTCFQNAHTPWSGGTMSLSCSLTFTPPSPLRNTSNNVKCCSPKPQWKLC